MHELGKGMEGGQHNRRPTTCARQLWELNGAAGTTGDMRKTKGKCDLSTDTTSP